MSFYAKRICEAVIVITMLMVFIVRSVEIQRIENQRETRIERYKILNQALWDQYGPGSKYAYNKIFDTEDYEKHVNGVTKDNYENPWKKTFESIDTANAAGVVEGILGVDEAPDWFDERLDAVGDLSKALDEALKSGLYLAAPDEVYFATDKIDVPNFLHLQLSSKALRHYAMRQWHRGEHKEAIHTMNQIIQAGDAFKKDPTLIAHLIRVAVYDMGLYGMERFLWLEPTLEDLQLMQESLMAFDLNDWVIPGYSDRNIWYDYSGYDLDKLSLILLLTKSDKRDEAFAAFLDQEGAIPNYLLSPIETASVVNKWTTIPAMKKRLQHVAEGYYENDPFLKPEDAKKMPALWYAAYRYNSNPFGYNELNANTRFDVAKAHMQLLRQAVWARIVKEQSGQFPNRESYQNVLDNEVPDDFHNYAYLYDPGVRSNLIVEKFKQIHYSSQNLIKLNFPVKGLDQWDERKIQYSLQYSYKNGQDNFNYFVGTNPNLTDIQTSRTELVNWTEGIFKAFKPIVKSVTLTNSTVRDIIRNEYGERGIYSNYGAYGGYGMAGYGMGVGIDSPIVNNDDSGVDDSAQLDQSIPAYLTVELDLPKETLWFVHSGPNKLFDEGMTSYDPSNGLTSVGDIYQFVGWK